MTLNNRYNQAIYVVSIVLAMILKIAPWPMPVTNFTPDWILMTLLYWALTTPDRSGIISAWFIGLLTDVLTGRLLGQNALSYALCIYISIKQNRRLRHYTVVQQGLFIFFILFLSQLLVFWIENLQQPTHFQTSFWLPVVSGTLLWPVFYTLLNRINLASRISK